jgi:Tfp pilus assembly protein PilN
VKGLNWIKAVSYYVLRIDLSDIEVMPTSGIIFRRYKDKIDKEQEMIEMPLKDMLGKIPHHSNVLVVFTGDQVLTRYSSGEPKNLFEEIEEDDFYFQKMEDKSGWIIQSACRKSTVDPILDILFQKKYFVLHMAFDPVVIPVVSDLIGDTELSSGHFRFQFRNGNLQWIMEEQTGIKEEFSSTGIDLEGMFISSNGISMLSGLVHYMKEYPALTDEIREYRLQSNYYRRFRRTMIGTLSGLFIILLVNFLLLSSAQQNLDQLEASGESQAGTIREIELLKTQIDEYRHLSLNRINSPDRSYSFYLEEVARQRPSGVWFNQLVVDPIIGRQEAGKPIKTNRSLISLKGETRNPVYLNSFIKSLKDLPWVRDIELRNYETSQESNNASFELSILKLP